MTVSSLACSVIGTTSLTLSSANGYEVNLEGFGPGPRTYKRETISSPFTRGRWLIDAQLDQSLAPLSIWVGGSTASQLSSRLTSLLAVFDQLTYTFQAVIDGVTFQWACEPADVSLGSDGAFDFWDLGAFQQVVHMMIPRDPLPVAGAV